MVFAALGLIEHDALEDGGNGTDFDAQAGFFPNFAYNGIFETLAGFDQAAGKRPFAGEGRSTTLDEKDTVLIENQGSDAQ